MKTIRLALVGDHKISDEKAKDLAEKCLSKLRKKYNIESICTIQEDIVGKYARLYCKKKIPTAKRVTYSSGQTSTREQRSEFEITVGKLMWEASHFVIFYSGVIGYAHMCIEQCYRMRATRKFKIIEI